MIHVELEASIHPQQPLILFLSLDKISLIKVDKAATLVVFERQDHRVLAHLVQLRMG